MDAPRVLLAGDSISFGYGPGVMDILRGEFDVHNLPGNGGTSANLLSHLDDWLLATRSDVIHLNCGLHDLAVARDTRQHRVPLSAYKENLERLVLRLEDASSVLIWASTTPVIYSRHRSNKNFDRRESDVVAYNRAARMIMAEHGVPVDDLHRAIECAGRERCIGEDGVHMTDYGNGVLAKSVAECLRGARP
jgi:lysophospholipase L1-like esterase